MPSPAALALKLNQFVEKALADGLVLDISTHVATNVGHRTKRVSWQCPDPPDFLACPMGTLDEYLYCLRHRHFSLVTLDGSVIQLSFEIHKGACVAHRLNYLPCPIDLDSALLELDSLDNLVEGIFTTQPRQEIKLRSAIRFDYDPDAIGENHPASHLTVNFDTVRIPVKRVLDASTFLSFIWRNFFVPRHAECAVSISMSRDDTDDVFDLSYRTQPHIAWDLPA